MSHSLGAFVLSTGYKINVVIVLHNQHLYSTTIIYQNTWFIEAC